MHVTLRVRREAGFLRKQRVFREIVRRLARASEHFRVVHYSVQADHLHLVEASSGAWLARKMTGLTTWLARRVNALLGRSGPFFADRYHRHDLRTPSEVRNALVYVLKNHQKHVFESTGRVYPGLDPFSSSPWFTDGWSAEAEEALAEARADQMRMLLRGTPPPLPAPETWLAKAGWRRARGGVLGLAELPRVSGVRAPSAAR